MEDRLSITSGDSIVLSEEFEIILEKPTPSVNLSVTPTLNIAQGNLDDLKQTLTEVLHEPEIATHKKFVEVSSPASEIILATKNMDIENNVTAPNIKKVGQSTFYDNKKDIEQSVIIEKVDDMKPECNETDDDDSLAVSDIDQDCTVFNGITYLGAANINAPKSEAEIHRNMSVLNGAPGGLRVSVSVPSCSEGVVVLYDGSNNSVMARYEIHRILFYARGAAGSPDAACFAFTWSHGDSQESAVFQCHVFRCEIAEAVGQASKLFSRIGCFAKAFQRVPRSMVSSFASASDMNSSMLSATGNPMVISQGGVSITEPQPGRQVMFVFEVAMEIREQDTKGQYNAVPKDRSFFKLRCNVDKEIYISVQQVHSAHGMNGETCPSKKNPSGQLEIDRCFGVLLSPGRHVRHGDMQLLEMVSMGSGPPESANYDIRAQWDPMEPAFESLNVESIKEYITVAVDLVIKGIREPVRLLIETAVKIFSQNERFWYFSKRSLIQQFFVNLKEVIGPDPTEITFEVLNIDTSGELDRNRLNLTLNLANLIKSSSIASFDIDTLSPKDDDSSDGDEPLLSGTGEVSKECCESVLEDWAEVLRAWQGSSRPKQLADLVKMGIPEALRGEVWQRLANSENNIAMMDRYRVLITKESSCENVIQRDINRTFPAHDFFREAGGLGQDSLYRVSKAYAVYDSEVGYCQGLSFLAATLLLHMPEEQAFCVLVKLMYGYGLRDLYKDGFENLYLRLYQLNSLMEEQLPSLWQHFCTTGIATHMFASQWFLTLFTARFPLYFVFNIIDVFLMQGVNTLFQVALALLSYCKKDLLQLDFEGVLKYFRVSLPKKCRTEEVAKHLIQLACSIKLKKLKKYEMEFLRLKADQDREEKCTTEIDNLKSAALRNDEEKRMLIEELTLVKDMLVKSEIENKRSIAIINEYKQICKRQDEQHSLTKSQLDDLKKRIQLCSECLKLNNESSDEKAVNYTLNAISHPLEVKDNGIYNKLNASNKDYEMLMERVRELELELAETKLAHVEAECRNQDLNHQLNATLAEIQNSRNSWPPWLSKTLTSIKEQVATRRDLPTFQSYTQNNHSPQISGRESKTLPFSLNKEKSITSLCDNESLNRAINKDDIKRTDSLPHKKTNINRNSCEIKNYETMAATRDSSNFKDPPSQ